MTSLKFNKVVNSLIISFDIYKRLALFYDFENIQTLYISLLYFRILLIDTFTKSPSNNNNPDNNRYKNISNFFKLRSLYLGIIIIIQYIYYLK